MLLSKLSKGQVCMTWIPAGHVRERAGHPTDERDVRSRSCAQSVDQHRDGGHGCMGHQRDPCLLKLWGMRHIARCGRRSARSGSVVPSAKRPKSHRVRDRAEALADITNSWNAGRRLPTSGRHRSKSPLRRRLCRVVGAAHGQLEQNTSSARFSERGSARGSDRASGPDIGSDSGSDSGSDREM